MDNNDLIECCIDDCDNQIDLSQDDYQRRYVDIPADDHTSDLSGKDWVTAEEYVCSDCYEDGANI